MSKKRSDEEMLDVLRELAGKLGRVPTTCDVDTYHRETGRGACHSLYCDRFGGWAEALGAAGLGAPKFARYYSDEKLCELLRAFAKKLGHTPLRKEVDVCRGSMPCAQTYYQRFGSWKKVIAAAGLVNDYHYRRDLEDEDLIEAVCRLADSLGRTPTVYDLALFEWAPCYATYRKRFGSWSEVLERAGLKKPPLKNTQKCHQNEEMRHEFKRTQILGQLKRFVNIYGCIPSPDKLGKKTQTPCYRTCVAYFGSWQATLEALAEVI